MTPRIRCLLPYFFLLLSLALMAPLLAKIFFFRMPGDSAIFDCDDGTRLMYERFAGIGIESVPIAGNLKLSGEEFPEIDHVWLLAEIFGRKVAFDWGMPQLDRQHYEGYTVGQEQLARWIEHDFLVIREESGEKMAGGAAQPALLAPPAPGTEK